jgi:hypothetical protein
MRSQVLQALEKHINQRSGIDWRNYYSSWSDTEGRKAFSSERYEIARDGKDARALLLAVATRDISTTDLLKGFTGRLVYNDGTNAFDYYEGQYFPTEYRAAACRALVTVLWDYLRNQGYTTREQIQKWARDELGRGICNRWFN